jgi:adenylyl cyclase-associated protein
MFRATRGILLCASACKKPTDTEFAELMKPIFVDFNTVAKIKDDNSRNRDWLLHFQTVAEGVSSVAWLQQVCNVVSFFENPPLLIHYSQSNTTDWVTGQKDSAEFYGNRVIKEYKEK